MQDAQATQRRARAHEHTTLRRLRHGHRLRSCLRLWRADCGGHVATGQRGAVCHAGVEGAQELRLELVQQRVQQHEHGQRRSHGDGRRTHTRRIRGAVRRAPVGGRRLHDGHVLHREAVKVGQQRDGSRRRPHSLGGSTHDESSGAEDGTGGERGAEGLECVLGELELLVRLRQRHEGVSKHTTTQPHTNICKHTQTHEHSHREHTGVQRTDTTSLQLNTPRPPRLASRCPTPRRRH